MYNFSNNGSEIEKSGIKTSTLALEHVNMQGTLERQHISTQDTLGHERVSMQDTLAREHVNTQRRASNLADSSLDI